MAVSGPGTTDRRDAAVASALAGAVVVLVGYAAGLGITSTSALTAPSPSLPPSAPVPAGQPPVVDDLPGSAVPPPAVVVAPVVSWPVGANPAQHGSHHPSPAGPAHQPGSTPTPTPTPTAAPSPTPPQPDPTCHEGLIDSLPVVGPLAASAVATVLGVLGSLPEVPGSPIDPADTGELVCPSTPTREVLR